MLPTGDSQKWLALYQRLHQTRNIVISLCGFVLFTLLSQALVQRPAPSVLPLNVTLTTSSGVSRLGGLPAKATFSITGGEAAPGEEVDLVVEVAEGGADVVLDTLAGPEAALGSGIADSDPDKDGWKAESRVAICLVGGARAFELTVPGLREHLLPAYERHDVFVHAPLDADSHKFTALQGVKNLVSMRVFAPMPIAEQGTPSKLLRASDSPNAIQGLLQYFKLVEGCVALIEAYEEEKGFRYSHVLRTRVDGYWIGPPPPLSAVPEGQYLVPPGSGFGGLNDRFGLGQRAPSLVALRRLSMLQELEQQGYKKLNSESSFMAQLAVRKVSWHFAPMPFCILTRRTYDNHGLTKVFVTSMSGKTTVNGAKCKPCTPVMRSPEADTHFKRASTRKSYFFPDGPVELCNATAPWEDAWEKIYDQASGAVPTALRRKIAGRPFEVCIREWEGLAAAVAHWQGPPAPLVCLLRAMGPLADVGGWAVARGALGPGSRLAAVGAVARGWLLEALAEAVAKGKVEVQELPDAAAVVAASPGDLLMVSDAEQVFELVKRWKDGEAVPFCQVLLEFPATEDGVERREKAVAAMQLVDLHATACLGNGVTSERCTFISTKSCIYVQPQPAKGQEV